ncbi:MAG TPA: DUF6508 domain-containing protein [Coriobacteriia bacterium]|nr:DUF6508 domain-containing protein [Coriobacteriia bacterium]
MSSEPTGDDLLAVCTFARRFEEPDFVAGGWVSPEPSEDGVALLGYWVPSEDVARWQAALYEHHIVLPFDWTAPSWRRQMRCYYEDPGLLQRARLLTIRKVLTSLVRADRFCEGTLAEAFERGVPQAAMRRLGAISGE